MSNKTAENSESSDAVDQDDVSSDKDSSAKARKMKLRRKRRKSSSGRVPPALTASAGSDKDKKDKGDGAKSEAREKDREKAKKRKKLRDKRDEGRSRSKESRSEDEAPKEKAKSKSEASEKSDSAERKKRREAKKKESSKSESRKRDKSKKSSTGDSDDSSAKESSAPKESDEKKDSQKEKEDRSAEKEAKRAERLEAKAERRKERLEKRKSKQEKKEDDKEAKDESKKESKDEAKKESKKESKKDEKVEAGKDLQLDSEDLKKTPIEESKSSKGSRKSMRLKAKLKRKRRKKKRADMTASEAALVSDVSGIEEVSAIEEISAIEEVESSGKSKKAEKKRSKAKKSKPAAPLGERISPDSDELNCEEFHEIDDEKMAIKGLKITLDRPAIAKKDAEKLRAKKAKDKPKKAKSEIEEVEEIEEIDEIEEVSSKGSKSKKKDEDDAVVIEDIEEIEEIEEVATKGSKSKKDGAKKAKKAKKADEISEIEEIDDIEEVSAKSTKKKSKTGKASKVKAKPDKKSVKAGDTFELDDNEIEEVAAKPKKIERKFDKSKSGEKKGAGLKSGVKKGADKKGAGGKKRAGLGDRSRSRDRDRDRDEAPVQKTSNFVPILAFGGILGVLIIALIYVASDDTGSNKPNRGAERQAALKLTVKEAIAYAESKSSERYGEVMERLKVLQKVTDKELKTKIDKKIKALQKAHLDEAQEKYDLLAMKALEQIDKGEVDRAIKTIDSFPAQYRDTNIWVNEAIPFINKALKSSSADSEGEPLLKAAERLRQAKKPARALGMLAGFSKDHAQTPMGAKIRELREAIRADVIKEQRKLDAQREREAIKARAAARANAAEEQVQKIRDLASNDDYPWIRQTGKNLFTWQIRQDYDKNTRIFSLSGRTITMKNTTGRAQILAKNKNDWKVFIVKFKVRLKTGRWSFLGKCLRAYNGRQQAHFMDRLTPQQSRNEWLDITIYVLEDGYYQVINNGDLEPLTADEGDGRSVGGFGFWVASGTQVEIKDIEAKVIERGRLK